jgi:hypothetical protein
MYSSVWTLYNIFTETPSSESVSIDGQQFNQHKHNTCQLKSLNINQYNKMNGCPSLIQAQTGGGVQP